MTLSAVITLILAAIIILVSAVTLLGTYKKGRLLSLVGGLHLNTLVTMGIGPALYVLLPPFLQGERVEQSIVFESGVKPFALFVVGYIAVALLDLTDKRRVNVSVLLSRLQQLSHLHVILLFGLTIGAILGIQLGLATSGVGTIFAVLYVFTFPIVTLAIARANRSSPMSWLILAIVMLVIGAYCFTSSWRSLSIMFAISVLLGIATHADMRLRSISILTLASLGAYIWVYPFLQAKKNAVVTNFTGYAQLFAESQRMPMQQRLEEGFAFIGTRMNGVREMGYVQNGLQAGITDFRRGESYKEALLQLIPRVIWPSKPSLNRMTNFILPREVGLAGWEDGETSAGVGPWAEAIWNVPAWLLPPFVFLVFRALGFADQFVAKMRISDFFKWWTYSCLFYLSMGVTTLITFITMAVWTIVISYAYQWLFSHTAAFERRAAA